MRKPTFMPGVPAFFIRMVMGEFGSTLLKGQKVVPKRLLQMGFRFRFSEIQRALEDLIG
jgi:NAD dependent epimerase/dehydratase family enzyme